MTNLKKFCHAGKLEMYHSMINKLCSKRLHFSWNSMVARTELAIFDRNSGTNFDFAKTKDGQERFRLAFQK